MMLVNHFFGSSGIHKSNCHFHIFTTATSRNRLLRWNITSFPAKSATDKLCNRISILDLILNILPDGRIQHFRAIAAAEIRIQLYYPTNNNAFFPLRQGPGKFVSGHRQPTGLLFRGSSLDFVVRFVVLFGRVLF